MSISDYDTVKTEMRNGILWAILNRPDQMNALSPEMVSDLLELIEEVRVDDDVRALVITGHGKAFSAGGDVKNYAKGISAGDAAKRFGRGSLLAKRLFSLEKPYVSAVNGTAAGAGVGLALSADFVIASDSARFVPAFMRVGLIPDFGLLYILPRIIGMRRAKDILFAAKAIEVKEAEELGLINLIVTGDELETGAQRIAVEMASNPPLAFAQAKALMHSSYGIDYETFLEIEAKAQALLSGTDDFKEGIRAFLEKRKPEFSGK
jgi:2-(1,2-epoxy-1,2-dihydrophenyl)acetyl-CoA isomerase